MDSKRNELIEDADMKRQFLVIITVALVPVFAFLNHAAAVPVADFTADVTAGPPPLTVNFTDNSSGNLTSWEWDLGDGRTSTEQNPSHTYIDLGIYTVSLTVTGPGGSDTETIPGLRLGAWQFAVASGSAPER